MDYKMFKDKMKKDALSDLGIDDQLIALNDIVDEENVNFFYPKKVYTNKDFSEVEAFIFESDKFIKITFENTALQFTMKYYKDIIGVQFDYKENHFAKLSITFNDGVYEFDSTEDFGAYEHKARETLKEIYKTF